MNTTKCKRVSGLSRITSVDTQSRSSCSKAPPTGPSCGKYDHFRRNRSVQQEGSEDHATRITNHSLASKQKRSVHVVEPRRMGFGEVRRFSTKSVNSESSYSIKQSHYSHFPSKEYQWKPAIGLGESGSSGSSIPAAKRFERGIRIIREEEEEQGSKQTGFFCGLIDH